MAIKEFRITFEYEAKAYTFVISWQDTIWLPREFHAYDERGYYCGQLLYYQREGRWRFYYRNQDNIQGMADIMGELVMLGYG